MTFAYRIYLDSCCLNRPFDNQAQDRIRLESEAILMLLSRCQSGVWRLITSDALDLELTQLRDRDRYQQIQNLLTIAKIRVTYSLQLMDRAVYLQGLGIDGFDAVHIASAELGRADILLTTDDRLCRKAMHLSEQVQITVANPTIWLAGILQEEDSNA